MKTILVIDDEPALRMVVRAVMEDAGWRVMEASSADAALKMLARDAEHVDVILLDVRMPGISGDELLAVLAREYAAVPVVMLTAFGTVGSAVEAMKKGAFDYLTKPADNDELLAVAEKAREYSLLLRENERLHQRFGGDDPLAMLVGEGKAMRLVRDFIRQAGPSEGTVLIYGESGTGKERIADGIHAVSARKEKPLIKVNCAAIPEHLLESELFGYVKGAFTGAVKDKPGRFQLAHGGTLFLDEIGEMPLGLQAKLLRVLQERVVEPLGSIRPIPVDVRIIAAANKNLQTLAKNKAFREDLFFRLNVLEITAPPLRDRLEDIPALVSVILLRLCRKNKKQIRAVSPDMLAMLGRYTWPGNVRELENILERAVILSLSDVLYADSLPAHFHTLPERMPAARRKREAQDAPVRKGGSENDDERDILLAALKANNGHRERTAAALAISRRTLQYKLKKLGLAQRGQ